MGKPSAGTAMNENEWLQRREYVEGGKRESHSTS